MGGTERTHSTVLQCWSPPPLPPPCTIAHQESGVQRAGSTLLGVTVKVLSRMLMTGRALQGYRGGKQGGEGAEHCAFSRAVPVGLAVLCVPIPEQHHALCQAAHQQVGVGVAIHVQPSAESVAKGLHAGRAQLCPTDHL